MRSSFLLAALLLGAAPAAADEPVVQHTDTANGFVLAYPASWRVVPGNIAQSKFKVTTPDPQGMETCSRSSDMRIGAQDLSRLCRSALA